MSPNNSSYYRANSGLSHIEPFSQFTLRYESFRVNSSNSEHIDLHEVPYTLKPWISGGGSSPALLIHISNVIGLGSEKKMARPNAQRDVTFMQHTNESTASVLRTGPKPATIGLFNLIPKTLFCGHKRRLLTQKKGWVNLSAL